MVRDVARDVVCVMWCVDVAPVMARDVVRAVVHDVARDVVCVWWVMWCVMWCVDVMGDDGG